MAFLISLFISLHTNAQVKNPYKYNGLSHVYYAAKKDSLEKNWICPVIYKEKATQKKYKEIWEGRKDNITNCIERRCFIYEKLVYNYIDSIISDLTKASPKLLPGKPLLLIDRSSFVNAYALGSDIIAVNLGFITYAHSREEIAFAIAHELSHNILHHADSSMQQTAELLTSEEYKESLKSVLDSKYGRFTRLLNIYKGYGFSRSKHSRYHESDADSVAVVLMKAAKIAFDPTFLLHLDSADIQYKHPLKQPVSNYFKSYNLPFDEWWSQRKSSGLSTRSYNFKDTTGIEDSLKTHPDCDKRYAATLRFADKGSAFTPIPQPVMEKATKMLIWNLYDDNMLTTCLYRVLMEKDNGNTDIWYDFMVHNVFAGLMQADKRLNRFNAVGLLKKELISVNYYELQNMLEQMPREKLELYYKGLRTEKFWGQMNNDGIAFKELINTIILEDDGKEKANALRAFTDTHGNSMYNEYTDHFSKK